MPSSNPKSVLITGATGALGSVVARHFEGAGWRVLSPKMDVTDPAAVAQALAGQAPDALVHCAGGFRFARIGALTDADLDFLLDVNLKSALLLARAVIPGMLKRGFGRVVFVSSKATLAPPAGMAAYAASKAGLNALTLALAEETKGTDVTVNAVLPTVIDTPANRRDMPQADPNAWVSPDALAEIIMSFTTDLGRSIHGALLPVAGRV